MSWITPSGNQIILNVHVVPRAARDEIQGLHGDALKIRLRAPPVEGRANQALIDFLGDVLNLSRRNIELLSGAAGRRKRVAIAGLSSPEIRRRVGVNTE